MIHFNRVFFLLLFAVGFVVAGPAPAFAADLTAAPIFWDDFEGYRSDRHLQKSYTTWGDGAEVNFSLEQTHIGSGRNALRVDVSWIEGQATVGNGSLYYVLPILDRNWSGATAARFWIENSFENPLLLSFNFKEEYNEFWAVAADGVFLLESEEQVFLKKDVEFGNLVIPAHYQGFVLIPFYSLSLPDWNTARGDGVMDLSRVESWAFGLTIDQGASRTFYLDDIAIVSQAAPKYLEIEGQEQIEIPLSGEHREPFKAYLFDPGSKTRQAVRPMWTIEGEHDERLQIDVEGWLLAPAAVSPGAATLRAVYSLPEGVLAAEQPLTITAKQPQQTFSPGAVAPAQPTATPVQAENAYQRFSGSFEAWAAGHRPLFVVISIFLVLALLVFLTSFQRKL